MQVPTRTEQETSSHAVFTAIMWAMSYPGEKQSLEKTSISSVGLCLLDLETSFYTKHDLLTKELLATGAKSKNIEYADYLFFLDLSEEDVIALSTAKRGTLLSPEHSATVVLDCSFYEDAYDVQELKLTGPGIKTDNTLNVAKVPKSFWELRNKVCEYPLGWDVILCDGSSFAAIPRSTKVILKSFEGRI